MQEIIELILGFPPNSSLIFWTFIRSLHPSKLSLGCRYTPLRNFFSTENMQNLLVEREKSGESLT